MQAAGNIKKGLLKRQQALNKFKASQQAFLLTKQQITKEIEEARIIWLQTLEQLPNKEFS
ncbi:MAG: hypothetical protein WCO13_12110 [Bacteroidota bacterium]